MILLALASTSLAGAGDTTLKIGQSMTTQAPVTPSMQDGGPKELQVEVERLVQSPVTPLSLEIAVPSAGGERIPVTTFSLFGLRPGQTATFSALLPPEAAQRIANGALPLELRLKGSGQPASEAGVEVKGVVVSAPQEN